jgi:hypothetical protein
VAKDSQSDEHTLPPFATPLQPTVIEHPFTPLHSEWHKLSDVQVVGGPVPEQAVQSDLQQSFGHVDEVSPKSHVPSLSHTQLGSALQLYVHVLAEHDHEGFCVGVHVP